MDKYIKDLISIKDTVIIPKFGALLVTVSGKGIIMFNEHLKFNDGVLIGHVSEAEGIDKEVAQKKVEEYAYKIMGDLDTGEPYNIPGLGAFFKDSSGSILFNQYKEGQGEEKSKPVEKPKKVEIKNTIKPSAAKEPVVKPATEKSEEKIDKPEKPTKVKEKKADKPKEKKESAPKKEKEKSIIEDVKTVAKSAVLASIAKETKDKVKELPKELDGKTEGSLKMETPKPVESSKDSEAPKPKDNKPNVETKKDVIPPAIDLSSKELEKTVEEVKKDVESALVAPVDAKTTVKEKITTAVPAQKPPKKKKKRLIWLILLLLLIGVGTFTALKFDMVKSWFSGAKTEVSEASDANNSGDLTDDNGHDENNSEGGNDDNHGADSSQEEEVGSEEGASHENGDNEEGVDVPEEELIAETDEEPETIVETPVVSASATGSYHVIASAFQVESNADKYVNSLKEMGYNGAKKLGRFSGFYQVSAGSYDTNSDAKAQLSGMRSKTGKQVWIFKY